MEKSSLDWYFQDAKYNRKHLDLICNVTRARLAAGAMEASPDNIRAVLAGFSGYMLAADITAVALEAFERGFFKVCADVTNNCETYSNAQDRNGTA